MNIKRSVLYVFPLIVGMVFLSSSTAFGQTGDVNNDNTVDLKDVIMSLQVCAGLTPEGVSAGGDADGNSKISLEEAIYGLQIAAQVPILPAQTFEQSDVNISYNLQTGNVTFLSAEPGYAIAPSTPFASTTTAEEAARFYLSAQEQGSFFGLTDQAQELATLKVKITDEKRNIVRFQQKYNDIPVIGAELVVQMDAALNLMSVSGEIIGGMAVNTTPSITADAALQTVLAKVAEIYQKDISELIAATPELWIYNPLILGFSEPNQNMLVWRTEATLPDLTPFKELVLVEAHSGTIVLNFNQIDFIKQRETKNATGTTPLTIQTNSILCRSEGQGVSGDADCDKAHDYAGDTYDFYLTVHGRDSIDNAGMKMLSYVHVPLSFFPYGKCNAGWDGEAMLYGDGCGLIADDVVAHEMTHGVTEHESDLIYLNQSGAINESFSDIWGEIVDQNNAKGNDDPAVRWKMGEDTSDGALRDMKNPPNYDDPDRISSSLYYCGSGDRGGVHWICSHARLLIPFPVM